MEAVRYASTMREPLHISALLLLEFRQSTRWQTFLHGKDSRKGFDHNSGVAMLANIQANIASGAVLVVSADWADVYSISERLSAQYTRTQGHRTFDILHVATALHFGAKDFLTFDVNQKKLAKAEGLKVPL